MRQIKRVQNVSYGVIINIGDSCNHKNSFHQSCIFVNTVLSMFTATERSMQMQTRSSRSNSQTRTSKKTKGILSPIRLFTYLFTAFIDVLINIPVMNTVWRERREMELLTDEHIKDIGLNPESVNRECRKSFFDIPANRKRSYKGEKRVVHTMLF